MNPVVLVTEMISYLLDAEYDDHIREAAYEAAVRAVLDYGPAPLEECEGADPVFDRVLRLELAER